MGDGEVVGHGEERDGDLCEYLRFHERFLLEVELGL